MCVAFHSPFPSMSIDRNLSRIRTRLRLFSHLPTYRRPTRHRGDQQQRQRLRSILQAYKPPPTASLSPLTCTIEAEVGYCSHGSRYGREAGLNQRNTRRRLTTWSPLPSLVLHQKIFVPTRALNRGLPRTRANRTGSPLCLPRPNYSSVG